MPDKKLALYIHIPFCQAKCDYCDFYSHASSEKEIEAYFQYLHAELEQYSASGLLKTYTLDTLFVGGGTPSIVSGELWGPLIAQIHQALPTVNTPEISIEINPDSINEKKMNFLQKYGFNRFSFGIQSTKTELRKTIGRNPNALDIKKLLPITDKLSENQISLDFLMGIPGQKKEDIDQDFSFIDRVNPAHISWYELTIYPQTRYGEKNPVEMEEDQKMELHRYLAKKLQARGYAQYEVSNYSKPGFECRHNKSYWKLNPYIGLGESAASYIKNTYTVNETGEPYRNLLHKKEFPIAQKTIFTPSQMLENHLIFGLRLKKGIQWAKISSLLYSSQKIRKKLFLALQNRQLIIRNNRLLVPARYYPLLDSILLNFI